MREHMAVGRVHCLQLGFADGGVCLTNVHLVPNLRPARFENVCRRIASKVGSLGGMLCVAGGDSNFTVTDQGRLSLATGAVMFGSGWDSCFKRRLLDLVDVAQHHPARREIRDRAVVSVSRFDRFDVAAATVELLDMSLVASVIGIATEYDRASDHLPVRRALSLLDSRPRRAGVIPRWVAEHEEYEEVLSQLLADVASDDPYV